MRVKTNVRMTGAKTKKTNTFPVTNICHSDEETTSLTSNSSASESAQPRRSEERRNRRSKGAKKTTNAHTTNNSTSTKNRHSTRRSTQSSSSKATSSKPHDAPMQKRDMYFALDCEMVGIGPEGLDSALARLSIINWDNELVFDSYVKVSDEVTDYRTFVSGIRREDIEGDGALTLEEVQFAAFTILKGKILIGHGLENDLKVIGISHPYCDVRDTATYQPYMRHAAVRETNGEGETTTQQMLRPRKLRDLTWETLGKQIQVMGVAHSPIEDANATMDLYKAVRTEWELSLMGTMNQPQALEQQQQRLNKTENKAVSIMSRFSRKVAVEPTTTSSTSNGHRQYMFDPRHANQNFNTRKQHQQNQHHHHHQQQLQQHYDSYIPNPQPVGGAYNQNASHYPTTEERLASARVAQQHARIRASAALQYQTTMQSNWRGPIPHSVNNNSN